MRHNQFLSGSRCIQALAAAAAVLISHSGTATPIITSVVETGGDNEATDTISAKWTGVSFVNGVANEPILNKAADASYTVGLFGEDAPAYVDRAHQWNGATAALPIPAYLLNGEYITSGNDNRDNVAYRLDVTVSGPVNVYLLIDNRVGDGSNTTPPSLGPTNMQWMIDEGWQPVKNGANRAGDPEQPDEVGIDEGAAAADLGVGPGVNIQNYASIYKKQFAAGTFTLRQADATALNMYGVVVTTAEDPANLPPSLVFTNVSNGAIFYASNAITFTANTVSPNSIAPSDLHLFLNGTNVSGGLTIGGTATSRTASYSGLAPNRVYTTTATATDSAGRTSTNTITFDTYGETTTVVIESEDYNYGTDSGGNVITGVCSPGDPGPGVSQGGGFQNSPVAPSGFTPTPPFPGSQVNGNGVGYLDTHGVAGVDFSDSNATTGDLNINPYRTCDPVGVAASSDFYRQKYIAANVGRIWDMDLQLIQAGEWLNYTRTFATTNYHVYLRARASTAQQVALGRVTSDRTQGNQTVLPLGVFNVPVATGYSYIPLTDSVGASLVISLSGIQTLRLTAVSASNNLSPNFIMLVPTSEAATIVGPVIASAIPAPGATNVSIGTAIDVTITNRLTTLNAGSIQLFLNGNPVSPTVTPTAVGATVFYQPPSALTVNTIYNVRLVFRDNEAPANSFTNDWTFTTTGDIAGPTLLSAIPRDQAHKIVLTFSEMLSKASAENISNYSVTNAAGAPLAIVSAALENNGSNVTLMTARQATNTAYGVRAAGVADAVGNPGGGVATFTSWVLSPGFVMREYYSNVTTSAMADLLAAPAFPDNPTTVTYLTSTETQSTIGDNYGERLSGLLIPLESGNYLFFVSSDDQSLFYLSTDENPANAVLLAQEMSYTPTGTWTGDRTGGTRGSPPSNVSTNPIPLVAGQRYYFQIIHREGTGGDSLGLNWQTPGQPAPENFTSTRITGQYLASYADSTAASVTATQQPLSHLAFQNQTTSFSVGVQANPANSPMFYQWQVSTDAGASWNNIVNANNSTYTTPLLTLADNNKQFRAVITVPGSGAISTAATLSVSDDTAPPMLRYRAEGNFANSTATLHYSELMEGASAGNPANYTITGPGGSPLQVLSAQLAADGTNVVLTTSTQTQGARYTVTVVGTVRDLVGNSLAPNFNGQRIAVFYSGGTVDFARIDVGPSSGRVPPGWIGLSGTPAANAAGIYPATQFTSLTGVPFTFAIDNTNISGTTSGGIDWRDRGDSTSAAQLAPMAEDFAKNNAGIIHVTLRGLPAGNYSATSFHLDMTPGGANQSDNVRVFVNGALQPGVRGNADQVLDIASLTDAAISNSAARFSFVADGANPVSIHFDGSVNVSRTDTETPFNGLILQLVGGTIPLPSIALTAPTNGQLFAEGANIALMANVSPSSPDDPITKVEYFANGVKIGEATSAPWSVSWNSVPRGSYAVQARVTDVFESAVTSQTVNIVVDSTPPIPLYSWASVDSNGAVQVTVQFDEPLLPETKLDPLYYSFAEAGPIITNIASGHASNSVVLGVSGLSSNVFYTLEVSGVSDFYGNVLGLATNRFALPLLQINFQLAGAPIPSGYLSDEGWEFGDRTNGYHYGWETNATDDTRDRNNVNETDQRYDTLAHFQRGQDFHIWEVEIPNGNYDVFLAAGDTDNTDQTNNFNIEGAVVVDPDGRDNFDQYFVSVQVADGRLTIMPAAGAINSKVQFVNVAPSASGPMTLGRLSITLSGGNITVTWPGPGHLQESATVDGPYTDVPGNPASGYTTGTAGPMKYYRLAQ